MFSVSMDGDAAITALLENMPANLAVALALKIRPLTIELERRVKLKLSGPVLKVRSGRLRRSINHRFEGNRDLIKGAVFSSGDVKYGAIHEYGGRTKPHIIVPKKAAMLSFMQGGKRRFASMVKHPGSVMPERSFMRSSLKEMSGKITNAMTAAVDETLRDAI